MTFDLLQFAAGIGYWAYAIGLVVVVVLLIWCYFRFPE
jgi:O-antigen/teichoic acid export membrane protein